MAIAKTDTEYGWRLYKVVLEVGARYPRTDTEYGWRYIAGEATQVEATEVVIIAVGSMAISRMDTEYGWQYISKRGYTSRGYGSSY